MHHIYRRDVFENAIVGPNVCSHARDLPRPRCLLNPGTAPKSHLVRLSDIYFRTEGKATFKAVIITCNYRNGLAAF